MSFIAEILQCRSLSIVGLEKNTGKTECLNYILKKVRNSGKTIALTSIGIDGEARDQVCQIAKPEIEIYEKMLFVTSEQYFREKHFPAEILAIGGRRTALGRLVKARAILSGKVILSGPPDTFGMKLLVDGMAEEGVDLTIIDGALSRLSHGSPTVSEALILTTGAAVSGNPEQLVRRTKYVYDLIRLEEAEEGMVRLLSDIHQGIWAVDEEGMVRDLQIPSALMPESYKNQIFKHGHRLFVAGIVTDKLLNFLRLQQEPTQLIVSDFTKIFALPETFYSFLNKGSEMRVMRRSRLLAVCINPQAPNGYCLDSALLKEALEKKMGIPVYDVRKIYD